MGLSGNAKRRYQLEWLSRRRSKAIELLGSQCVQCGSTDRLEFDHIDPQTKDLKLKGDSRQGFPWSWAWHRIEIELTKCQLLCHDCHLAKTVRQFTTACAFHRARKKKCTCVSEES